MLSAFYTIGAPKFALVFIGCLIACALLSSVYVLTSYFAMTETGIRSGYFFGASGNWKDVEAWTRWGKQGSVFLRFRNGRIIGTTGWAFYGDRVDELEALLRERVGGPTSGDEGVLPRLLDLTIGSLIRNGK